MRIRPEYTVIFVLLLSVVLAGCYTMIVHPTIQTKESISWQRISLADNCIRCHTEAEVQYFYQDLQNVDTENLHVSQNEIAIEPFRYFNYPWWYETDWSTERLESDHQQALEIIRRERENIDRRDRMFESGSSRGYMPGSTFDPSLENRSGAQSGSVQQSKTRSSEQEESTSSSNSTRTRETNPAPTTEEKSQRTRESNSGSGNQSSSPRSGSTRGK